LFDLWGHYTLRNTFQLLFLFSNCIPTSILPSSLPQHDLAALEKKVNVLSEDSQRLSKTYPDLSALMREREREVATAWKSLLTKSHSCIVMMV